jgi:hypothetical protein
VAIAIGSLVARFVSFQSLRAAFLYFLDDSRHSHEPAEDRELAALAQEAGGAEGKLGRR